jgi:hypothetical protein
VVKLLSSEYLLGEKSRAAGHWVKMKPEYGGQADCSAYTHTYIHSLIHTYMHQREDQTADLDLAILGGYYGESGGERGQGVAKFLCGGSVKTHNDEVDGMFVCMYV